MAEGWPLPWPFPWAVPPGSFASASFLRQGRSKSDPQSGAPVFSKLVEEEARKLRVEFGAELPAPKSVELYLIEALSEVVLPGETPAGAAGTKTLAVIYPPEFLFVLDVGLECRVGGVVSWQPVGYGDPAFPEKKKIALRSIVGTSENHLVFPNIAGSLIVGLREGTPEEEVRRGLTEHGIRDIQLSGFFATGNCRAFEESSACAELQSLPFVKYAEANGVRRLVDFLPGWRAKRLV